MCIIKKCVVTRKWRRSPAHVGGVSCCFYSVLCRSSCTQKPSNDKWAACQHSKPGSTKDQGRRLPWALVYVWLRGYKYACMRKYVWLYVHMCPCVLRRVCLYRHATHIIRELFSCVWTTRFTCFFKVISATSCSQHVPRLLFHTHGLTLHRVHFRKLSWEKVLSHLKAKNSVLFLSNSSVLTSIVNYIAYQHSHFASVTRKLRAKLVATPWQASRSLCEAFLAFFMILFSTFIFQLFKPMFQLNKLYFTYLWKTHEICYLMRWSILKNQLKI